MFAIVKHFHVRTKRVRPGRAALQQLFAKRMTVIANENWHVLFLQGIILPVSSIVLLGT
jgi:hypothetical protein